MKRIPARILSRIMGWGLILLSLIMLVITSLSRKAGVIGLVVWYLWLVAFLLISWKRFRCPKCGNYVGHPWKGRDYCVKCGAKLEWDTM